MNETQEAFNPVRAVRESLKMTQEAMALELGCSINTERRCEYESRLPTNQAVLKNLRNLARQAGVKLEVEASST